MFTRRSFLSLAGTMVLAGCAGTEDSQSTRVSTEATDAETDSTASVQPTNTEPSTETKTVQKEESMSQDAPEILTEETHPIKLDPAPPDSWEWQRTRPRDIDETELSIAATYARSLDEEYTLRIDRYATSEAAQTALAEAANARSGFVGTYYGVQRGRFFIFTRSENATEEGSKKLLQRVEGVDPEYVEQNVQSWTVG